PGVGGGGGRGLLQTDLAQHSRISTDWPGVGGGGGRNMLQTDPTWHSRISTDRARGGVGVGGGQSTTTIMQQQSLHFEPLEQAQQTPVIDEFLEQIFAMPWEYNNAGAGGMGMERVGTGGAMNAAAGPRGSSSLVRSVSMGSSGSEDSGGQPGQGGDHSSSPPTAPNWQQPYVGVVPPLPTNLAHAKAENTLGRGGEFGSSRDNTQTLGKRFREDEEGPLCENHSGITVRPQEPCAPALVGVRPRVRARRGQATDPHSIAERLRRERIAERMKALQELVPNSNKTDKASMLDEIIDYLKFLQLQVKILSMSRLGGAGAVASTASDPTAEGSNNVAPTISRTSGVPSPVQDGLALTERQVTQLMEDDMGSAMQYLQSKGLCLMPIALATAISTTNSRGATAGVGDRQRTTVAASNGGLVTDGLVSEQSSKDNNRDIESAHATTSMPINKAPKGEGKPSDGP
ncbi:unnamed protein product, partial [Sphagnum troendelagicum]